MTTIEAADTALYLANARKDLHGRGWAKLRELPEWEIFAMTEDYHEKYGACTGEPQHSQNFWVFSHAHSSTCLILLLRLLLRALLKQVPS